MKDEPRQVLRRCGAFYEIGADHFIEAGQGALAALRPRLDAAQCGRCTVCVFDACEADRTGSCIRLVSTSLERIKF